MPQSNMLITHYGLFWSERSVFWGWQKNPGQILGRIPVKKTGRGASNKDERIVENFRDYVGIYCLYGDGGLIYVGQTGLTKSTTRTLFMRLNEHRRDHLSGRWDKFSWFGCERSRLEERREITRLDALAQLEAILIAATDPRFNKQSGKFGEAAQVFQVTHSQADGSIADKLKKMEMALQEIKETVTPTKK